MKKAGFSKSVLGMEKVEKFPPLDIRTSVLYNDITEIGIKNYGRKIVERKGNSRHAWGKLLLCLPSHETR